MENNELRPSQAVNKAYLKQTSYSGKSSLDFTYISSILATNYIFF